MLGRLKRRRHLAERLWLVLRSLYVPHRENQSIVVVGSAHKVGSTWLYELVRDLGGYRLPLVRLPRSYFEHGVLALEKDGVAERLGALRGRFIFKTHSAPIEFENPNIKLVSIYRDPRDILVSSAFYLANLEEARGGWGGGFAALTVEDRLIKLIHEGEFLVRKLEQWFRATFVFSVSYEELLLNPGSAVRGVVDFLELGVDDQKLMEVIEAHKFKKRAGARRSGVDNSRSFLRKGISGDWCNHFTESVVAEYKRGLGGRWERLLIDMGYESDPEWTIEQAE